MTIHPAILALIAVIGIANIYIALRQLRRRFARFFGKPKTIAVSNDSPEFTQINAFADALHVLCHDYGVEMVGIVFDEETRGYSTISYGTIRCDAADIKRVRDYKVAALMLEKDAAELFEAIQRQQPKVEEKS